MTLDREQSRILYEIALQIGGSLDLPTLLERSLETLVKKLDGLGGAVFADRHSGERTWLDEVKILPETLRRQPAFAEAVECLTASPRPESVPLHDSHCYFLDLPRFGTLLLFKNQPLAPAYLAALPEICDKLAEACLVCEAGSKYRGLVESSGDWTWEVDEQGIFTYAGPQLESTLGYQPEEVLGKTPFDLMPPEEGERIRTTFHKLLKEGKPLEVMENTVLHKDGRRVVLETSGVPIKDGQGNLLGYRGIDRDITERKRAEESLQAEQKFTDSIVESMPGLFYIIEESTARFVRQNANWPKVSGYSEEELAELTALDLVVDKELCAQAMQRVFETGHETMENELLTKSGKKIPYYFTGKIVLIDGKQYLVGMGLDISERKRMEKALRKNEERLDLAMSVAHDGLWDWDLATNKTYFDPRYYTMIGHEPNAFPCTFEEWEKRVHPEDILPAKQAVKAYLAGEIQEYDIEFRFQRKDGDWVWIRGRGRIVARDDNGTPLRLVGTHTDITDQKEVEALRDRLENQLRQAQKMEAVGQLAGGVAHDFNNILQAILGYGELAWNFTKEEGPLRTAVDEILKASNRAKTLVSQLLAFSRRQVLEMEYLDLNEVVAELMKMVRRVIGAHITLEIIPGHDLGTVRADRGQIAQIITNLCVNASDAMPEGGNLVIETENIRIDEAYCRANSWATPGRFLLLSVTDTGEGMDEEILGQIFDPFFTTKEMGKGTGLGLATVYGLVRQHGGMVHPYSEVGKGSTFKIYLPLVERPVEKVGDKIQGPVPTGTETILLAEDDEMVRRVCRSMLEFAGYTVLSAADGVEALRIFTENAERIDLALLDVVMPGIGGRAVFDRIKKEHPEMRVLFASGYSMNAIHTNFILDEGLSLIQKPYQQADLLRKVREVFDR